MENKSVFVLLAGGQSSRMGVAKGLLKFKQTFWVLEQLERISKSDCSMIILGLGHNHQHYFTAIPWLKEALKEAFPFLNTKLKVVLNPNPELGQFSTLQECLKEIQTADAILISPIDTPIDRTEYLNKLIACNSELAQLNFEGKNGHPIKISRKIQKQLITIDVHDSKARLDIQLKKTNPAQSSVIKTSNRDCIINFNTPTEWKEYLASID